MFTFTKIADCQTLILALSSIPVTQYPFSNLRRLFKGVFTKQEQISVPRPTFGNFSPPAIAEDLFTKTQPLEVIADLITVSSPDEQISQFIESPFADQEVVYFGASILKGDWSMSKCLRWAESLTEISHIPIGKSRRVRSLAIQGLGRFLMRSLAPKYSIMAWDGIYKEPNCTSVCLKRQMFALSRNQGQGDHIFSGV